MLLTLAVFAGTSQAQAQQTLYSQSLQAELSRTHPHLEMIVLDLATRQILADTFARSATPIPAGSLLKPFLALALLSTSPHPSIDITCHGHADRCWRAGGHGKLTLPEALAESCNAYFLAVARALTPDVIVFPTHPPRNATAEDLIGLTPAWAISPATLADAYAQLLTSPDTPPAIREGMRLAATTGTASLIGAHPGGVLAKTGTAPCRPDPAPCQASSDGLVVAAVPADHPILLLLVRRRAATGALAAQSAGPILTQLKSAHAY